MALIADDPTDRAEQLLLVTERLTALVVEETRRIDAREPPLDGDLAEEKQRLANAYRLELARIKDDKSLIEPAAPTLLAKLRKSTALLQEKLAEHEVALSAVKLITEGMVQAMAEEVARQRGGDAQYGAHGGLSAPSGPRPAVLDRQA
ncbi:MAG TPA: flagellar basal-body protein FlbY [Terricaulis sp.]|nr:flagellar basal-body protein FlbY [Terricaulis sp.]